ncbi:MAG: response regulator transcription factor [Elusimicrobia bacterium]|nr:response regulator transcription factor [Elusimicrobiota bacterium]
MSEKAAVVLVVDDDKSIHTLLEPALKRAGYAVRSARTADQGLGELETGAVDLVLLDFEMPRISGLEFIKMARAKGMEVPIIMMTVHGRESEKVTGLGIGADDYVVKPFSVKEMVARVGAHLRRTRHGGRAEAVLEAAGVRVDLDARRAVADGKALDLTVTEFELLARFLQRKGMVLSYQQMSDALSEGARILTSNNLQTHVGNLRKKLGGSGERIETVQGIGYRFNPE